MAITTLTSADKTLLDNSGVKSLPDNLKQFSAAQIKAAMRRPNLLLFDWVKALADQTVSEFGRVTTLETNIVTYMPLSGGSFTGAVTFGLGAKFPSGAQLVFNGNNDNCIYAEGNGIVIHSASFTSLDGTTKLNNATTEQNPTTNYHVANKAYVDEKAVSVLNSDNYSASGSNYVGFKGYVDAMNNAQTASLNTAIGNVNSALTSHLTDYATKFTQLEALANGKSKSVAVRLSDNALLASAIDTPSVDGSICISTTSLTDVDGNSVTISDLKKGDVILITEVDKPDLWYHGYAGFMKFYKMETTKVDLSSYAKTATTDSLGSRVTTLEGNWSSASTTLLTAQGAYSTAQSRYEALNPKVANLDKKINTSLTKAEYDALTEYDADTIYMVAEE